MSKGRVRVRLNGQSWIEAIMERRSLRPRGALVALMGAVVSLAACRDIPGPPREEPPLAAIWPGVVSDPVAAGSSAALALGATSGTDVVYISLAPGTIPGGEVASIRNRATGSGVLAAMVAGGLDPVPVSASAGDTLDIAVRLVGSDSTLHFVHAVAAARRPIVVRTDPPPRKRDVPLNAVMLVVFSEPIDRATLTGATVQLLQGTTPVAGQLEFRDPANLTGTFVAAAPLAASTDYRLTIAQGIRDLDGEALEAPVTIEFTTVGSQPPPQFELSQVAFASAPYYGASYGGIKVMNADASGLRTLTTAAGDWSPTWSPQGGKLAFQSDRDGTLDIYVMNYDGSGVTRLTADDWYDSDPAWSPDGARIAFHREAAIYVMNAADGSGVTRLADASWRSHPTWSPDGLRIAFSREEYPNSHIYVINGDGSGLAQLTDNLTSDGLPAWSPDGTEIAFVRDGDLYVMNADGSGVRQLTRGINGPPSWSPDSRSVVFEWYGMHIVNADGSGLTRLRSGGFAPAWSPVGSVPPRPEPYLSLRMLSGDAQSDTILSTLPEPLRVFAYRDDGAPVPGVTISWRAEFPGPFYSPPLSSDRSVTDASGAASVTLTFGPVSGRWTVEAAVLDGTARSALPVVFTATARTGRPVGLQRYSQVGIGAVGSTLEYSVSAHDAHGNVASGVPITWTVTAGGGTITPLEDTTAIPPGGGTPVARAAHTLAQSEETTAVAATVSTIATVPPVTFTATVVTALVVVNWGFAPDSVRVPSGRTVGWLWPYSPYDEDEHNVTFEDDPNAGSGTLRNADTFFTRLFTGGPRTIRYRCTLHSTSYTDGEVGTVTVQ